MSSLAEIMHITLPDLIKEQFLDQSMVEKVMKLEKIRMQRTRAANKGIQKLFVETYNKTHTDSKLKLIADGIIAKYKTNDN